MKYLVDRIQLGSETTFLSVYFNFSNDEKPQSVSQPGLQWLSCHSLFQSKDQDPSSSRRKKRMSRPRGHLHLGPGAVRKSCLHPLSLNANRRIRKARWDLRLRNGGRRGARGGARRDYRKGASTVTHGETHRTQGGARPTARHRQGSRPGQCST